MAKRGAQPPKPGLDNLLNFFSGKADNRTAGKFANAGKGVLSDAEKRKRRKKKSGQ